MPVGPLQGKTHLEIETSLCFAACWDEVLPERWFHEVTQIIYTHKYIYIYHTHTYVCIYVYTTVKEAPHQHVVLPPEDVLHVMLSLKGALHLQGRAPSTLLSHRISAEGGKLEGHTHRNKKKFKKNHLMSPSHRI
jgi:hypothetical protein